MRKTEWLLVVIIAAAGAAAGYGIYRGAAPHSAPHDQGAEGHEGRQEEGPHGGRLIRAAGLEFELTIYETGVPPHFRLYVYQDGQPVAPGAFTGAIEIERLGGRRQVYPWVPEADYLRGDGIVGEPHGFRLEARLRRGEQLFQFGYEQDEGRVEMADATRASSGIELLEAGPARIRPRLRLPGEIVLDSNRVVRVRPRATGVVQEVRKNLGESVQAGELLLVMDSAALAEAHARYQAALERRSLAKISLEREQGLRERRISSEESYLQARQAAAIAEVDLQAAGHALAALGVEDPEHGAGRRLEIRAPLSGVVLAKQAAPGELLSAEDEAFVLADLSQVWAEVTVYANDLPRVQPGQEALLRCPSLDCSVPALLSYLAPVVGEATRSAKARFVLDNAIGHWRPGLFVTVDLVVEEREVPVAVSGAALQRWRDLPAVFVRHGAFFEVRPVETGLDDGAWVEIRAGLAAGELYAAANSFVVKAELEKAGATHDH